MKTLMGAALGLVVGLAVAGGVSAVQAQRASQLPLPAGDGYNPNFCGAYSQGDGGAQVCCAGWCSPIIGTPPSQAGVTTALGSLTSPDAGACTAPAAVVFRPDGGLGCGS